MALYDENNSELGRYRYNLGGAPEYIHPSEEADYGDGESENLLLKILRIFMEEDGL